MVIQVFCRFSADFSRFCSGEAPLIRYALSPSEGYPAERFWSETILLPRLDALHVADGDQAGAEVFVQVGLATDADPAGKEWLGVKARRDIKIGDRRTLAADQSEDLVAIDLPR